MPPTSAATPDLDRQRVGDALPGWRRELAALGGRDTLLEADDDSGLLDLATAHPSGLATFLASRPTRLSSLFREPAALAVARRSARAVRRTASRLTDEHGLPGSHLALGLVTLAPVGGRSAVSAPVLLAPVRLTAAGDGDLDVALTGGTRLNASLLRVLGAAGVPLDEAELMALAEAAGGSVRPALRRLRELTAHLTGAAVTDRAVIGTFVDLGAGLVGALDEVAPGLAHHPVVQALLDPTPARAGQPPANDPWPRGLDEPPPALPLDPAQLAAVDAVRAGADVTVSAPSGTGQTQVVAQLVAAAAEADLSVLVVAPRRTALDDVRARLDGVGLGALAGTGRPAPDGTAAPDDRAGDLAAATRTSEDLLVQVLAARRALHEVRTPWGTSKLDVLRTLRPQPAPVDTGLLPLPALARLAGDRRPAAAALLTEAVDLGVGLPETVPPPWSGAALASDEAASAALAAVRRLLDETLPQASTLMAGITAEAGLAEAESVAGWERQLDLLVDVRRSLDVFVPAVYESPVDAMVEATATAQWRARHGSGMPLLRRRSWRRHVREVLRPGGPPDDVHAALVRVRAERVAWQQLSTGGGWPRVPTGLAAADEAFQRVDGDLARLEPVLAGSTVGGGLRNLALPELSRRLRLLERDAATLDRLPRRAAVHARVADLGLLDVLGHLRGLPGPAPSGDEVAAELEELWSRAVLDAADAQDAGLSGDPEPLRAAVGRVRGLRAAASVARERTRERPTATLSTALAVPHRLQPGERFDLVVLLGAQETGVAEAVLAVARARQVVVLGDPLGPGLGGPARAALFAAARDRLRLVELTRRHRTPRELVALADRTAGHPAGGTADGVPAPDPAAVARLDVVPDGTVSVGDEPGSPDAEVARVVQLVLEHVGDDPASSLAVVAGTRGHALRVAAAVRNALEGRPETAGWFGPRRPGSEPFVVTDLDGADAAARDHVLLTLGMGLTPHRRVVHRFGRLDGQDGDRLLRRAVTGAARRLTVVTSIVAGDLDPERVQAPGARALLALLEALDEPQPAAATAGPSDPVLQRLVGALAERGAPAAALPSDAPDAHLTTPDLAVDAPDGRVAVLWDGRPPVTVDAEALAHEERLEAALVRAGWRVARVQARDVVADAAAAAAGLLSP